MIAFIRPVSDDDGMRGAAIPTALVEEVALVGPAEKIRDDLAAWRESMATTLLIAGSIDTMRTMAELVL